MPAFIASRRTATRASQRAARGGGVASDKSVTWREVPDPNLVTQGKITRTQVPEATKFDGGEGLWHHEGIIYFTTKGDKKVWAYDVRPRMLELLYHHALGTDGAERGRQRDGLALRRRLRVRGRRQHGDLHDHVQGRVAPFVRIGNADGSVPPEHQGSEMAGVVFDPSGTRMYFSSQRAYLYVPGTPAADGALYEVQGPFRLPKRGVPAELGVRAARG